MIIEVKNIPKNGTILIINKNNNFLSLVSVLLLEGIYFYNFTTPEFNVNVCQMPFWALSVLYCWKGFKDNKTSDWLLFGFFAGLGILSKYLFIYLGLAFDLFLQLHNS